MASKRRPSWEFGVIVLDDLPPITKAMKTLAKKKQNVAPQAYSESDSPLRQDVDGDWLGQAIPGTGLAKGISWE